jgi:hypothetical protein
MFSLQTNKVITYPAYLSIPAFGQGDFNIFGFNVDRQCGAAKCFVFQDKPGPVIGLGMLLITQILIGKFIKRARLHCMALGLYTNFNNQGRWI